MTDASEIEAISDRHAEVDRPEVHLRLVRVVPPVRPFSLDRPVHPVCQGSRGRRAGAAAVEPYEVAYLAVRTTRLQMHRLEQLFAQ